MKAEGQVSMQRYEELKMEESNRGFMQKLIPSKPPVSNIKFKRPVLDCKNGLSKDYWELSHVELNATRVNFRDLIDSYGEMFVLLGFITLFAAAFPFGPALALLLNIVDTR